MTLSENPDLVAWIAQEVAELGGIYSIPAEHPPVIPEIKTQPKICEQVFKARVCAVYFLTLNGAIQYIGQSKSFYHRLSQHFATAEFDFDGFMLHECIPHELLSIEAQCINFYEPKWNRHITGIDGKSGQFKKRPYRAAFRNQQTGNI